MASSMFWAPVVGLVLGLIALLPPLAGLAPHVPELRALMWIAVMAWTTRALHWDGLADCMDAWGSGARGEQFQRILKDSRCGSFGVLALVLTLLLQELSLSRIFSGSFPSAWWPALLAPAWGRANMLLLPALLPPHPGLHSRPSHGSRMYPQPGSVMVCRSVCPHASAHGGPCLTHHPAAQFCHSAFSVPSGPTGKRL